MFDRWMPSPPHPTVAFLPDRMV